jgi:hypothetical protein
MVRAKSAELQFDFSALIEVFGTAQLIEITLKHFGIKRVLEAIGPARIIKEMGVDWLLAGLSSAQLEKIKERLK